MTLILISKRALGPADKPLYGCTIDFTFTRLHLKRRWDCPANPESLVLLALCQVDIHSSSVNWKDYSLNRIYLCLSSWELQANPDADSQVITYTWKWRRVGGNAAVLSRAEEGFWVQEEQDAALKWDRMSETSLVFGLTIPTPVRKSLQIIQQWFYHIPYAHYVKPNYDLIWGWWFHHHCILHAQHTCWWKTLDKRKDLNSAEGRCAVTLTGRMYWRHNSS